MLTFFLCLLGFAVFVIVWNVLIGMTEDSEAGGILLKAVFWTVVSPLALPILISMLSKFYSKALWRKLTKKEPVPGLSEFWRNPDRV